MAVSLAQLSQDYRQRPRAWSATNNMSYLQGGTAHMPMPEQFQQQQQSQVPPPPPQHFGTYGYRQPMPPYNPYGFQLHQQYATMPDRHSYLPPPPGPPAYAAAAAYPNDTEQPPPFPPRPPKTPIEPNDGVTTRPNSNSLSSQASSQGRPHSNSLRAQETSNGRPHSDSRGSTISSTIEPDPLPPHSNPQALTQSQSAAFEDSSPIPPVRLGKDEVWDSRSGFAVFLITREAAHMPAFLSTKPLLTVTRLSTNTPMGQIRFHTMLTSDIDLTINGRQTSISHSIVHNRWGFRSTTCPNEEQKWYWVKDKVTGGAKLEDSKKKGRILAKMKGDLLTFEAGRLSDANYDEVLLSAVAMAEAARRSSKNNVTDLASSIGEFASHGGHSGDGGGGGGS